MRHLCLAVMLAASGCAGSQLQKAGDAMIRVERGTEGVVVGISAAKDIVKDDCVEQQLETEAERMACVEDILAAVRGSKVAVQAVKAALVTFWTLYPVLEAKVSRGEKIGASDLAELVGKADEVVAAYSDLIKFAKEAKK